MVGMDQRIELRVADMLSSGQETETPVIIADLIEQGGEHRLILFGGGTNVQRDARAGFKLVRGGGHDCLRLSSLAAIVGWTASCFDPVQNTMPSGSK
ncbi:hypothetical protein GCM10023219_00600 [Stakelama sediminis]